MSKNSKPGPRPFWLIVKGEPGGRIDALVTNLTTGEEALPVFSFEDEAGVFIELGAFVGDWRVRETAAGELISILYCLYARVDRVVLDPLPHPNAGLNDLLSMGREAFMKFAGEQGCSTRSTPIAPADLAGHRSPDRLCAKNRRARRSSQLMVGGCPLSAITQTAMFERR